MELPEESLVEHEEAEASVPNQSSSPSVIGAVESGVDLVQVVCSAESPLPEVILEQVVRVGELLRVSLCFGLFNQDHLLLVRSRWLRGCWPSSARRRCRYPEKA